MISSGSAVAHARVRSSKVTARRVVFVGLLLSTAFLPHLTTSVFTFPGVTNFLALLPFAGLMVLPLIDRGLLRRLSQLDLLVLLAAMVPLGFTSPRLVWPVLLMYPVFGYLAVRMLAIAREVQADETNSRVARSTPLLPRSWLLAGIAVLALVHTSWSLDSRVITDVGQGGVIGALDIIHGHRVYGPQGSPGGIDPHTDTYGPVNYEAYLPFAAITDAQTAAHLATLFFDLLTAGLLFLVGRRIRDGTTGVLLAYCWLAFPLTLYEDALGLNDAIVAASLVAVILGANSSWRRGGLAAIASWTKLTPLALIPLLAGLGRPQRRQYQGFLRFTAGFGIATCLVFLPVLGHSSLATFVSRTFGFQSGRATGESLWDTLQFSYGPHVAGLEFATKVAHGLLTAAVGAGALLLFRVPRRIDAVGIAATSAAILIAIEACLNYWAYSYILWFAPLVLIASIGRAVGQPNPPGREHGVSDATDAAPAAQLAASSNACPRAARAHV
jgi:hypothetical protein